jgi:hypothetical protein
MNDPFNVVYRPDPDVIPREIAGEMLLVPVRRNIADLQSVYVLNDTALAAWQLIDGIRNLGEIRDHLAEDYSVDQDQAGQDLLELAAHLEKVGVIQRIA